MLARSMLRGATATVGAVASSSPATSTGTGPYRRRDDILEWATANKPALRDVAKLRHADTLGALHYLGVAGAWVTAKIAKVPEKVPEGATVVVPATTTASPDGIQQYYASQELRNAMKWRRVTWDLSTPPSKKN